MASQELEKFVVRILFNYTDGGREIAYIYNREALNDLTTIQVHKASKSQFIEVGDVLMLEGYKCKVVSINFKLDPEMNDMTPGYGINILSPTPPTNFNCQIGIFVERL